MKKRIIYLVIISLAFIFIVGCNCIKTNIYELALITDKGDIDDKSFNQGAWEGLVKYATDNKKTRNYYRPAEATNDAYIASIGLAVEGGAKVVVTPGYLFETAVNVCQTKYPKVKFIILDGNPASVSGGTLENNVYAIFYAEEQAGFLAGYAAVMDGYRNLGFMGGIAVPPVIRFGHGFIFGANKAAEELALSNDEVKIKYHYTNTFNASPDVQSKAAGWYSAGTEVIFACGGAIGQSIMAAAEASNKKVIGVDVNQKDDSSTVITSAMKGLGVSVISALEKYYNNKWDEIGGKTVSLGADVNGVGLPDDFSRFKNFTKEAYDVIFNQLVEKTVVVTVDISISPDEYTNISKVKVYTE